MGRSGSLAAELRMLIGEDALVQLAEAFGGTRLYIPVKLSDDHEIVRAIGLCAASAMAGRFSPDTIKIPLARNERARHHRAAGKSNAQIARALGMTETGVEMLFRRLERPSRASADMSGSNDAPATAR